MDPATAAAAIEAGIIVTNKVIQMVNEARARGEWTPEQEAAFDARLAQIRSANPPAHWVVEPTPK